MEISEEPDLFGISRKINHTVEDQRLRPDLDTQLSLMGKKDKTKGKTKNGNTAKKSSNAFPEETAEDYGGVAATNDGWGPATAGEPMDNYGSNGWGEEQQHLQWIPNETNGNDNWDSGPDISAWLGSANEEASGMMGFGAKKHPSAAVRMSQANSANMTPEVADLLNRMSMTNGNSLSPKRAPTELSVHRSSAAFTNNPARSGVPTRTNSINGSYSAPLNGTFPSLPSHAGLQQTRFFPNRSAPLSTIHSEQSAHTLTPEGVETYSPSNHWEPTSQPPTHFSQEPMGYMMDDEFAAEVIGMQGYGQDVVSFQESGGEALRPANKPLFKSERPAEERIRWGLSEQQDESVRVLLGWIETMSHGLAQLALHKYINTRSKGALISNAQYRPAQTPDEPAFDWITFEQARGTLDRRFQEGILHYNPSTNFIVYVILLSETGNSVGIWKRKLDVPKQLRDLYAQQLEEVNEIAKQNQYVVAVERLHPGAKTLRAPDIRHSTKPMTRFSAAAQPPRARTTSAPSQPGKLMRSDSKLKKEHPPEKKEKRSTWSKIFGGKK